MSTQSVSIKSPPRTRKPVIKVNLSKQLASHYRMEGSIHIKFTSMLYSHNGTSMSNSRCSTQSWEVSCRYKYMNFTRTNCAAYLLTHIRSRRVSQTNIVDVLGKPFFGSRQPARSFRGGRKLHCLEHAICGQYLKYERITVLCGVEWSSCRQLLVKGGARQVKDRLWYTCGETQPHSRRKDTWYWYWNYTAA